VATGGNGVICMRRVEKSLPTRQPGFSSSANTQENGGRAAFGGGGKGEGERQGRHAS